ncbi:histidine kinase [Streptomyces sp. DSM 41527]|uniref:histidine kinase n=1 Tax=Streptomyces mooreae TaxID=3075523 RepID=A0ABU2TE42_9ACTN|nr:histidine kinase [Streptomyces sp. DSM 41527]MDT0459216.1 histidine kinase [Streptomyces sp. DSM 41527]
MREVPVSLRAWSGRATALAAVLLLTATFGWAPDSAPDDSGPFFAAATALVGLQAAAFRWAPCREAAVGTGLAAVALMLWAQPLVPGASLYERAGMGAFWFLPTLGAAVVGGYPRLMARRGARAVREARHRQQLELAHDLHDFVAHDISGIVAQAQAARFVAGRDPQAAAGALERIERAGLAALASIDRTVHLLREPGPEAARTALPGTARLTELVDRFDAEGRTRARLTLTPAAQAALSREAAATVQRVVTEALTNVRRHAPEAAGVEVALTHEDGTVRLTITNDTGRTRPRAREHGGTGLLALTERVRALNGTLHTTRDNGTWRLTVTLPAPLPAPGDPA